jgi:hypothetical protein
VAATKGTDLKQHFLRRHYWPISRTDIMAAWEGLGCVLARWLEIRGLLPECCAARGF